MTREYTASIVTGIDPVKALSRAVAELPKPIGLWDVQVAHDDGCPCIGNGHPMSHCTCEIVNLIARRLA